MRCRRNTPAELMKLQSEAPPMGWAFVKRRMAAELGPLAEEIRQLRASPAAARFARPGASRPRP
jgi:predicted unusual protein kinase regulating ubiquinone biosynthesis (AarF/ABC1/UbiB family)